MSAVRPRLRIIAWHAIRPHTLPLSLSPVIAGSVVGWLESGLLRADITAVAALAAASIQIGTNLHNDAVDSLNGTDRPDRLGPVRVTQKGWASAEKVARAAYAFFALAVFSGIYLTTIGGWPIVAIGLASVAAAYAYSGGPWPISRGPFGELFVCLFFGLIAVGGVAYLYTGTLGPASILMGLVIGLPAAGVLLINNLRDLESDRRAGRQTLAIVLGRRGSVSLFKAMLIAIAAGIAGLTALGWPWYGALTGLPALALGISIARVLRHAESGVAFNAELKRAAGFQLVLTLLTCLGLIVCRLLGAPG